METISSMDLDEIVKEKDYMYLKNIKSSLKELIVSMFNDSNNNDNKYCSRCNGHGIVLAPEGNINCSCIYETENKEDLIYENYIDFLYYGFEFSVFRAHYHSVEINIGCDIMYQIGSIINKLQQLEDISENGDSYLHSELIGLMIGLGEMIGCPWEKTKASLINRIRKNKVK